MNKNIAIIGLGLIGGSLAKALRKLDASFSIAAADSDDGALGLALADGVIGRAGALAEVCAGANIVVVAVPPLAAPAVLSEIARCAGPETVITDVASVKSHLLAALASLPAGFRSRFVPGHPLAGSEQSGYGAARAELFQGRNVVLAPLEETAPEAVAKIHALWRGVGANVLAMSPERHDRILALTSHLPHVLAFAMAGLLSRRENGAGVHHYAASGFADFTRLAASDPALWSDILRANAGATVAALDAFGEDLKQFRNALAEGDWPALGDSLRAARQARRVFDLARGGPETSDSGGAAPERCFHVRPGGAITSGRIRVPGDKSISHRAIMLGALAEGVSRVSGFLEGEDALHTLAAFRELGVTIVGPENGRLTIYGAGANGLKAPRRPLWLGNSGTAMRLLAGILAGQGFASELRGDESLSRRPMNRIVQPLADMGAVISAEDGRPPLRIGGGKLRGIDHTMPVASAQIKSCLLLAGLFAAGHTTVREPGPCRDHTERMLRGFGVELDTRSRPGAASLAGGQTLSACDIDVPGDISSAAFFMVAAAISPGASLTLEHVGVNPTRTGVIDILRQMGADIRLRKPRESGGEPVADIEVRQRPLRGVDIGAEQVALAIDEFPVLLVAAACAEGETRLRGAGELRVKESDRIEAMAEGLGILGIEHETFPDGIRVTGGEFGGGIIDSRGDHRIAMAFAIAALRCRQAIIIRNCANVATSFPGFAALARQAGLDISETDAVT